MDGQARTSLADALALFADTPSPVVSSGRLADALALFGEVTPAQTRAADLALGPLGDLRLPTTPTRPAPVQAPQPARIFNAKTGQWMTQVPEGQGILDAPLEGVPQMGRGAAGLAQSMTFVGGAPVVLQPTQAADATSDVLEGAMRVGQPALVGAVLTNPVTAALAVGAGTAAGALTDRALASADPSVRRLASNVAAVGGGALVAGAAGRARGAVRGMAEDARAVRAVRQAEAAERGQGFANAKPVSGERVVTRALPEGQRALPPGEPVTDLARALEVFREPDPVPVRQPVAMARFAGDEGPQAVMEEPGSVFAGVEQKPALAEALRVFAEPETALVPDAGLYDQPSVSDTTPAAQAASEGPALIRQPWEMTLTEFDRERPAVEGYRYHGSPEGDIARVDPYYHTRNWREGIGFYSTDSRDAAAMYARGRTARGDRREGVEQRGRINYVQGEPTKTLDMDAPFDAALWADVSERLGMGRSHDYATRPRTNADAYRELIADYNEDNGTGEGQYAVEDALVVGHGYDATIHTEGKAGQRPHRVVIWKSEYTAPTVVPASSVHRQAVERALSAGLPVPADVLADYPDLAAAPSATLSPDVTPSRGAGDNSTLTQPILVRFGEGWGAKEILVKLKDIVRPNPFGSPSIGEPLPPVGAEPVATATPLAETTAAEAPAVTPVKTSPAPKRNLTYEQFANEYRAAFKRSMQYSPNEAGSSVYTEKMAALADDYPEFLQRLEAEEAFSAEATKNIQAANQKPAPRKRTKTASAKPTKAPAQPPAVAAQRVLNQIERVVDLAGAKGGADIQKRVIAVLDAEKVDAAKAAGFSELVYQPGKAYGGREGHILADGQRIASVDRYGAITWADDAPAYTTAKGAHVASQSSHERLNIGRDHTAGETGRYSVAAVAKALATERKAGRISVQIPGDGTFTIERNPYAIAEVIRRIRTSGPAVWRIAPPKESK